MGEMVRAAWASLTAHKLRSFLTMLGILIGVGAIMVIVALGVGGQAAVISLIESQRLQRTIQIIPTELVRPGLPQPGQVLAFVPDDFATVRQFRGVARVYYTLYGEANVAAGRHSVNVTVEAGPSFLPDIAHFVVTEGRMYTDVDVAAHRPVTLISQPLAVTLFGTPHATGRVIRLGGHPLEVIGVTASTQANLLTGLFGANAVYLPGTTCRDLFPWWSITEMDVEVQPGVDKQDLARRIVLALNIAHHDPDGFADSTGLLAGLEHTVGAVTTVLTLVVGAIAGIALVVGGVGVMNIMLVSVAERTQEIGIRMALGATRRHILQQFLLESVIVTTIGGGLGVLCGAAGVIGVRAVTHFPAAVPWWAAAGSVVFSAAVGFLSGLYPARQAARLHPIDAIRNE
ncbi:putative ABC transporter permease YknZ [Alicyclobacillus cellulosilyticus]|uniref:ABC transporter permease YknZ n=1 Tax=Alicyclobacillus cellulosilyticus TaxID=1003997 RepID=A0A917NHW6_9BACL|nr:ABC transporter permease [Alicyclobacillus cellulosilyticus]GGJ01965.1 putative ABC transporter permease YknZ [Alicyclobacillus cellulosilyticus]